MQILATSGDPSRHNDSAKASVGTERSLRPDSAMGGEASRDTTAGTKSASDLALGICISAATFVARGSTPNVGLKRRDKGAALGTSA